MTTKLGSGRIPYQAWCPQHGKQAFTKRWAKQLIRELREPGLRKYRCSYFQGTTQWWHVGHVPDAVIRGKLPAQELYQQAARPLPVEYPRAGRVTGEQLSTGGT